MTDTTVPPPPPPRWNYLTEHCAGSPGEDETMFNTKGADGWELVTVVSFPSARVAYFKRPA